MALDRATKLFWGRGFAATSTEVLLKEMEIGRQSLYNAFGNKRDLYLEALRNYQEFTIAAHIERLEAPEDPLGGIRSLLAGVAVPDDGIRELGCFGVSAVEEFGTSDPEICAISQRFDGILTGRIKDRVREGQAIGRIDERLDADDTARFIAMTLTGLQVSARGGSDVVAMRRLADFATDRLRARPHPV